MFDSNTAVDVTAPERQTSGQELVDQFEKNGKDTVAQRLDKETPEQGSDEDPMKLMQDTPWWVTDYHQWAKSDNGTYYLSPIDSVVAEIVNSIPDVLAATVKNVLTPGSEESENLKSRTEAFTSLDQDDRALGLDTEVDARHKYIVTRAITGLMYAVRTQRELNQWAERLAAKGEERPTSFENKLERGKKQAIAGALLYKTFEGLESNLRIAQGFAPKKNKPKNVLYIGSIVQNAFYTEARIRTGEIKSPGQAKAEAEAVAKHNAEPVSLF